MEWAVEFGFNLIDYTYLLYFYYMLIGKQWDRRKIITGILLISVIQFIKDRIFLYGTQSYAIDVFLVTGFLFLHAHRRTLNYFFYALLIDITFNFCITFFISIAIKFGVNIANTFVFGYERVVFALCLKVFTVIVLWFVVKFLVKFGMQDLKTERITIVITIIAEFIFNYLLDVAKDNTEILLYTVLLTLVMVTNFYIFYRYSRFIQSRSEAEIIEQSINITSDYVTKLQKEQDNIRKMCHDMKNQLSVLSILLKDKKYDEANTILTDLCDSVDSAKTAISGNIFIDAILKQKMNEYADIAFHLDLQITKDFVFDGKYLISLLSNIIDNACEELRRIHESSFQLKINGNRSQLLIVAQNKCRETIDFQTDKDLREHGYGLKIIQEITNKYDGTLITDVKNGVFEIRVLLLFANEN